MQSTSATTLAVKVIQHVQTLEYKHDTNIRFKPTQIGTIPKFNAMMTACSKIDLLKPFLEEHDKSLGENGEVTVKSLFAYQKMRFAYLGVDIISIHIETKDGRAIRFDDLKGVTFHFKDSNIPDISHKIREYLIFGKMIADESDDKILSGLLLQQQEFYKKIGLLYGKFLAEISEIDKRIEAKALGDLPMMSSSVLGMTVIQHTQTLEPKEKANLRFRPGHPVSFQDIDIMLKTVVKIDIIKPFLEQYEKSFQANGKNHPKTIFYYTKMRFVYLGYEVLTIRLPHPTTKQKPFGIDNFRSEGTTFRFYFNDDNVPEVVHWIYEYLMLGKMIGIQSNDKTLLDLLRQQQEFYTKIGLLYGNYLDDVTAFDKRIEAKAFGDLPILDFGVKDSQRDTKDNN